MKRVLVYIQSSKGELDWIAPFVKFSSDKFLYDIFLDGVGGTREEKLEVLKDYGLFGAVNLIDVEEVYVSKLTFPLKVLNRLRGLVRKGLKRFGLNGKSLDFLFIPILCFLSAFTKINKGSYDFIFRDYNLRDSFGVVCFLWKNRSAKVVVYPHAVGIQPSIGRFPPIKRRCDLWLENTSLSDHALKKYSKEFFACGVPALSNFKSIFSYSSKRFLFITRNCREEYGFSLDEALLVFDSCLKKLQDMGVSVLVKHHPRDKDIEAWRSVQEKYYNVDEFVGSLTEVDFFLSGCFSFFSTAGLYLISRGVPVFDVSPYKKREDYTVNLPLHYRLDKEGCVTHDLVYIGVFDKISYKDDFGFLSCKSSMSEVSRRQKEVFDKFFPDNSCHSIFKKMQEI